MTHPTIITFASPKGGVGKSSICIAMAAALAARGYPVHILDLDQTQTIWTWYEETKPNIPNLTAELASETDFGARLKTLYHERSGFILIDTAGKLTQGMTQAATIAHLTITPTQLGKADITGATHLHRKIDELSQDIGKGPIRHRVLINRVAPLWPAYQRFALRQIDERSPLQTFKTLIFERPPYAEVLFTGQPPHYADRSRVTVQRAIAELDTLVDEVFELLQINHESLAA